MKYIILLVSIILDFCTTDCCGQFSIHYNNRAGAIQSIINSFDSNKMDWILSSSDSFPTWQKPYEDWDMGEYRLASLPNVIQIWTTPASMSINDSEMAVMYKSESLSVMVRRNSVSCDYLYPISVDGKPGKFYDAYANDQDWALVFYMDVNPWKD